MYISENYLTETPFLGVDRGQSVFIIINLITMRQINSPINALFYTIWFKMYNNYMYDI